ncbi:MAG: hypothetical protein WC437_02950 [Patescibacteria group bacterium]
MKITPQEIKNYELAARKYLAEYDIEDKDIVFDHFGLQTLSGDEYSDLKNYFIERSKFDGEVIYHNRRLGKFRLGTELNDKMELIEPHPGEVFWQYDCFVEHIAFRVKDLPRYSKLFSDRILSTFSISESKGFKIQGPSQLLIEFRSNKF